MAKYTPNEYNHAIWEKDSIEITEKNANYATNHLKRLLDKQIKNYNIIHSEFDDLLKAYKILYEFNLDKKEDNYFYPYVKTVWIKINFQSNNGDYIVKPQLIKLIAWKDRKE